MIRIEKRRVDRTVTLTHTGVSYAYHALPVAAAGVRVHTCSYTFDIDTRDMLRSLSPEEFFSIAEHPSYVSAAADVLIDSSRLLSFGEPGLLLGAIVRARCPALLESGHLL